MPRGRAEARARRLIALTHGHGDHVGDTVDALEAVPAAGRRAGRAARLARRQGVDARDGARRRTRAAPLDVDGVKFTLTDANHSSSTDDGAYLGEPAGSCSSSRTASTIYFAGDTNVFGDMQLIGRIYEPDVAVLPIGDHYTMGPREAAVALELLGTKRCVPCHYGTFPLLTGTPGRARASWRRTSR